MNKDLEVVDQKRQKEFKQYEMEKKYEYKRKLEEMDEDHMKEAMKEHEEQMKKLKEHPKLHHPGSKPQLEEVWEEQGHMNSEDFDPKTFFHLHGKVEINVYLFNFIELDPINIPSFSSSLYHTHI